MPWSAPVFAFIFFYGDFGSRSTGCLSIRVCRVVLPKLIPFCSWSSHAATIIIIFFLSLFVFWSERVFFPIGLPGPFLICTFLSHCSSRISSLRSFASGFHRSQSPAHIRPVSDACSWPGQGSAVESPPGGFSHAQFAKTGLELDFFLAVGGAAVFLDCLIVKLPARFSQKKKRSCPQEIWVLVSSCPFCLCFSSCLCGSWPPC
jgi:hypothetical protein